jgi:hypothetical protein
MRPIGGARSTAAVLHWRLGVLGPTPAPAPTGTTRIAPADRWAGSGRCPPGRRADAAALARPARHPGRHD